MALETGGSLYWRTKIDNTGLQTGAVQAKGILRGLTRSITGMDVFAGLSIGATLVFAKITKEVYNFSRNFESAMKEVQTISKAVQDNFKGISKEIIDMSKTVPDNAQKLSKALYQIVSAGYDGAEAMKILRTSAELAVATVTDTFTAADALTYVMNAYGKAAGTAAEISDKLFTIVKLGKVKMEELGPTISMVTGLAAEAGVTFNELAAIYAEAVKKIQPHIVSTGIRGIITAMLRVSKGTGDAAEAAREFGIEFDIAALRSKGFKQVLSEIIVATKGNEAALMRLFPNVRGLIGLLAIMTDEGKGFNKTLNEIENSAGATGKAFKIMMETTDNQFAIMKNNIMAKLKPLGDSILGFMNDLARGINASLSGATDEFSKMIRAYSDLTDTLQNKKNRIDGLITTIEDLKSKTELTKEETVNLRAAEKSLMILLPNLGRAAREAAGDFDILTEAKRGSLDLDIKIIESKLAIAEAEKKRTEIEIARFKRSEDESSKELERLEEEIDFWYKEIAKGGPRIIEEFYQAMREYPFDDFTKQIDEIVQGSGKAGIVVRNLGDRLRDIQEDMQMGIETTIKQDKLREEIFVAAMNASEVYQEALEDLDITTGKVTIKEHELNLELDESTIRINTLAETLEKLKELRGKPIITTPKIEGEPPGEEPAIIPSITDTDIEKVKDRLTYMASQYKKYITNIAEFTRKDLLHRNKLLVEEGEGYAKFLSDSLEKYKDNAELSRIISDDIFEYNNGILLKRKEAEKDLFNLLADDRAKALAKAKEEYDNLTDKYKEGSTERLDIEKQYRIKKEEINEEYDNKEAEARLAIFKIGWGKQIGEEKEAYIRRLEGKLKELEAEKVIDIKRVEFIRNKLNIIRILEEESAKEKKEILESYLSAYKTAEEKIVAINAETNKLIKFADDEVTKNKLENIRKQRIAEIKASEARKELDKELAGYGGGLNNKQLEEYIKVLEKMKVKYKDFAELVIYLNEKIADSQKQIWENVRNEIDATVSAIHSLADIVGNFDTELEKTINNLGNLVSGIGQIMAGFATGGILGFAGILGGIATAISAIINLFTVHHSEVPELKEELQQITLELQKQQNILSQSIGTAKTEAIKDMINLLREQIDVYNEMIEAEKEAYGQFLWWTWDETDQESIEQWLASIENVNAEIFNLQQQYQQILTGTTAETIADAIAEGFEQGLNSAQIFADTFNDMMKKAIMDAFKRTIITKYIEDWYNLFGTFFGGAMGLSGEELMTQFGIDFLATTFQNMLEDIETEWGIFADILEAVGMNLEGATEADITGLTGAIAGITEETAGLLAGQFQAIRINTVEVLSNMESIIIINSQIAENTTYNKYLESIDQKLGEGNTLESEYLRAIGG